MKRILLLMFIPIILLVGCSKESDKPSKDDDGEYITVNLNMSGEITEMVEKPLVKSGNNDLYAIQVYTIKGRNGNDDDWDVDLQDYNNFIPYAYGIFDNPNNLTIKLNKKHGYKIMALMIVDGKNQLQNNNGEFNAPINKGLTDEFVYDNKIKLDGYVGDEYEGITGGYTVIKYKGGRFYNPNMEKYYGELLPFTLRDGASDLKINMKRVYFGLKVSANNLVDNECWDIWIGDRNSNEVMYLKASQPTADCFICFSREDGYYYNPDSFQSKWNTNDWIQDDYYENLIVKINNYYFDRGDIKNVIEKTFKFTRNRQYELTVTFDDSGLKFEFEEGEMEDDILKPVN